MGGGAKWGRRGRCRGRGRGQRGGGPLSGRRQNLTAASPAQAAPPGSPPAAKAEHCELAHFAVNFPVLKNTLSHPRERPHLARPGAFRSGSRGVTAPGAAAARVRAGAGRGPLYGGPNSGEGAGREGCAEGHWFANAPELKGAGGGLWGGIIIRGQIAPPPARLRAGAGAEGDRRSEARAQLPCRCAAAGSPRAAGRPEFGPEGAGAGGLCGAGTMPLTLGCPLCARPRRPPAPRRLCTEPPPPQAGGAHGGQWGPLSPRCFKAARRVPTPAGRPRPRRPARPDLARGPAAGAEEHLGTPADAV